MPRAKGTTGCLPEGYRPACAIRPQSGGNLYYLGLGSNLGDRRAHLERAASFLAGCGRVLKRSSIYETTPVGMPGAGLFLNRVLTLESALAPRELLARCKAYEAGQGRDVRDSHCRDRAIDIDILLAGNRVMNTPELILPHPRLVERGFVLVPLFEIAPKLLHPVEKVTVARLLSRLKGGETIKRLD
jgi:2-amino-4-hydroxy-6-hydroxymethyldihydropteridine diphosphokinase